MFCSKCGNSLNDGAAFCPSCGTKVVAEAQKVEPVLGTQPDSYTPSAQPENQGSQNYYVPPVQQETPNYYTPPVQNSYQPPVSYAQPMNPGQRVGQPPFVVLIITLGLLLMSFIFMLTNVYVCTARFLERNCGMFGQMEGGENGESIEGVGGVMVLFIILFIASMALALLPVILKKWKAAFLVAAAITTISILVWFFVFLGMLSAKYGMYAVFAPNTAGVFFLIFDIGAMVMTFVSIAKIKSYGRTVRF